MTVNRSTQGSGFVTNPQADFAWEDRNGTVRPALAKKDSIGLHLSNCPVYDSRQEVRNGDLKDPIVDNLEL